MSNSKVNSIFSRIEESLPSQTVPAQIETQAKNSFSAVSKLFDKIKKNSTEEEYEELKKRFLNSLKTNDYRKFDRGFKKIFTNEDDDTEDL